MVKVSSTHTNNETVLTTYSGLFGGGLNEKVCEAVNFIANNWAPGDEIFLFGFSRGAYTARSIAGFICQVGLLTPLMLEYFYDVYEGYKSRKVDGKFEHTEWAKTIIKPGELGMPESFAPESPITRLDWLREVTHQHVKIKAIGVVSCFRAYNHHRADYLVGHCWWTGYIWLGPPARSGSDFSVHRTAS